MSPPTGPLFCAVRLSHICRGSRICVETDRGVCTESLLHTQVLGSVKNRIEAFAATQEDFPAMLRKARRYLVARGKLDWGDSPVGVPNLRRSDSLGESMKRVAFGVDCVGLGCLLCCVVLWLLGRRVSDSQVRGWTRVARGAAKNISLFASNPPYAHTLQIDSHVPPPKRFTAGEAENTFNFSNIM